MDNDKDLERILIVDDDRDIVVAIESVIQDYCSENKKEYEIATCRDGNTAVDMIAQKLPKLIILDQMLPGRSGYLVMEKINGLYKKGPGKDKEKEPYIIMITAHPGSRHEVYAETLGAYDYIKKPFKMNRLMDSVKGILEEK